MNELNSTILREVEAIEHHIHRQARSFGKSADQSGNNWCTEDRLVPFRAISGNGDYGSDANDEAKIFGSSDTPFIAGHTLFDIWGFLVVEVSHDDEYILRFIWGEGGLTMLQAIAAGQYSTKMVKFDSALPTTSAGSPIEIGLHRVPVGTQCWVQAKNVNDNAYIDFYITGAHGYNY